MNEHDAQIELLEIQHTLDIYKSAMNILPVSMRMALQPKILACEVELMELQSIIDEVRRALGNEYGMNPQ